jgi:hypothetical protein
LWRQETLILADDPSQFYRVLRPFRKIFAGVMIDGSKIRNLMGISGGWERGSYVNAMP